MGVTPGRVVHRELYRDNGYTPLRYRNIVDDSSSTSPLRRVQPLRPPRAVDQRPQQDDRLVDAAGPGRRHRRVRSVVALRPDAEPSTGGGVLRQFVWGHAILTTSSRRGQRYIYVRTWNADKTASQVYERGWFGYDSRAPQVTFTKEDGKNAWTNDRNKKVVEWTIADPQDGSGRKRYRQGWVDPGAGSEVFTSEGGYLTLGQHSDPYLTEGWHTAHVRACDQAGNWTEDITSGPYGFDETPPTATTTSGHQAGSTYSTAQRIEWKIGGEDGRSGVQGFAYAWDATPPSMQNNGTTGGADLPEGTHHLHVRAWDNAGNDKDWVFGPFTYQPNGWIAVTVDANSSVDVAGEVFVDGQSKGTASPSLTIEVREGTHTVSLGPVTNWTTPTPRSVDVTAGQTASTTGTYLDQTKPSIDSHSVVPPSPSSAGSVRIEVSATDAAAGLDRIEVWVDGQKVGCAPSDWDTIGTGDGSHTIERSAYDRASPANVATTTCSYFLNRTPPTVPGNVTGEHVDALILLAWPPSTDPGYPETGIGVQAYRVFRAPPRQHRLHPDRHRHPYRRQPDGVHRHRRGEPHHLPVPGRRL